MKNNKRTKTYIFLKNYELILEKEIRILSENN